MKTALLLLVVVLVGCKRPLTEEETLKAKQQENVDNLLAEIKSNYELAKVEGAPLEPALQFAWTLFRLGDEDFGIELKKGKVWATAWEDAWALLDRHEPRTDLTATQRSRMEEMRAYLTVKGYHPSPEQAEKASAHFTKCMEHEARWECFDGQGFLLGVAKTDEVLRRAIESCDVYPKTIVDDAELWVRAMGYCIERVGGKRELLTFASAKADLAKYDVELARLEKEKADKEADEERRREEESAERERRLQESRESSPRDDSARKDKCEPCTDDAECKRPYACRWNGLRDRRNNKVNVCGSENVDVSDVRRDCE